MTYIINMSVKPKAMSLFSGMGGDTLGMEMAGFDVIAFNEFDKAATNSHKLNFPHSTFIFDPNQKKEKDQVTIFCVFNFLIKIIFEACENSI